MPTILFVSGFSADRRIWADIPELIPRGCAAEFYEQDTSVPFIRDSDVADAAGLLPEGGRFAVVVSSMNASATAVGLALSGRADALLLIEPTPDSLARELPPPDFDGAEEQFQEQMMRMAAMGDAIRQGADEQTWRDMMRDWVRSTFPDALSSDDRELVETVAMDHAGETYAMVSEGAAATAEGRPWPAPFPPEAERWVERLSDVTVPVVIMSSRHQAARDRFLADRARHGRAVTGDTPGSPVWLVNRGQTAGALASLLPECGGEGLPPGG